MDTDVKRIIDKIEVLSNTINELKDQINKRVMDVVARYMDIRIKESNASSIYFSAPISQNQIIGWKFDESFTECIIEWRDYDVDRCFEFPLQFIYDEDHFQNYLKEKEEKIQLVIQKIKEKELLEKKEQLENLKKQISKLEGDG